MVHQIVVIRSLRYESHSVGVYQNHLNSQVKIVLVSRLVRLRLE